MASIKEMIAIVQIYIHHRKNVEVNIAVTKQKDILLLTIAYAEAKEWLTNNGFKQIITE